MGVDAEPKTFQIVRVKNVIYHPAYQPTTLNYDVAMLVLEDRLRFDTHIGSLCLDESDVVPSASYENCVTTGWGREVLKSKLFNFKDLFTMIHLTFNVPLHSSHRKRSDALHANFATIGVRKPASVAEQWIHSGITHLRSSNGRCLRCRYR